MKPHLNAINVRPAIEADLSQNSRLEAGIALVLHERELEGFIPVDVREDHDGTKVVTRHDTNEFLYKGAEAAVFGTNGGSLSKLFKMRFSDDFH